MHMEKACPPLITGVEAIWKGHQDVLKCKKGEKEKKEEEKYTYKSTKVWAVAANRSVKHLMSKKHVEIHILQQLHS